MNNKKYRSKKKNHINTVSKPKNKSSDNVMVVQNKRTLRLLIAICALMLCCILIAISILNRSSVSNMNNSGYQLSEYEYILAPELNYADSQKVLLDDLYISWTPVESADRYIYNIIMLGGEPDYGNDNEFAKEDSRCLAQNLDGTLDTSVTILKEELSVGKWVKIAVSACKDDYESWNSIYIYIEGDNNE